MFDFRLINLADGSQIIDSNLKTSYDSLTPAQMIEYIEIDKSLAIMERMKKKEKKETERRNKLTYKLMHKVACMCGVM